MLGSGTPSGVVKPAEGQEWESMGPDPLSHLSQATHLHAVCSPGGHRGTQGCSSLSQGENSPSPVFKDAQVPFWEAQAEDWEEHTNQASSQQLKQVGATSQTFSQPCPTHTVQIRAAKTSVLQAGLPLPWYYFSHLLSSSALHPGLRINKEQV